MKYDHHKIAQELDDTAFGRTYYGNALYVALDIPCVTDAQRAVLRRWLSGGQVSGDFYELQQIAIDIRKNGAITDFYTDRANSGQAALTASKP